MRAKYSAARAAAPSVDLPQDQSAATYPPRPPASGGPPRSLPDEVLHVPTEWPDPIARNFLQFQYSRNLTAVSCSKAQSKDQLLHAVSVTQHISSAWPFTGTVILPPQERLNSIQKSRWRTIASFRIFSDTQRIGDGKPVHHQGFGVTLNRLARGRTSDVLN